MRRKNVKKLFLVFLVLLVGMAGLSAMPPPRPGGGDVTPQIVIPQVNITVSIPAPEMPAPMWLTVGFITAQADESAFTEDIELLCSWSEQYREGLLTGNDFKTLVSGRIAVMYLREQALKRIHRIVSLAPTEFPLLC
jgi:hypothetical protein